MSTFFIVNTSPLINPYPTATPYPTLTPSATITPTPTITPTTPMPSGGTIITSPNLSLYSDSACTIPLDSINWGNLTAGGNSIQTIYIKNTGSSLSLALSMRTSNWNPISANGPITLTWNQEATRLQPGQTIAATLTLTVSPSIIDITNFSIQINIIGSN